MPEGGTVVPWTGVVLAQCCAEESGGFREENCFFSFPGLKDDAIKAVPLVFIGRSSSLTCHRIGVAS
ncbi:hypothetical protein ACRRTK_019993 [Alexandromys fortis]